MTLAPPSGAMPDKQTDIINLAGVPFDTSLIHSRIAELATLTTLDYEIVREAEAKELKLRISILDKLVESQRFKDQENEAPDLFEAVKPWEEKVDGAALLASIKWVILRFCALPEHSAPLMAC